MQGALQEERCQHAPWRGTRGGGPACLSVPHACLEPGGTRPSPGWAGGAWGEQGVVTAPGEALVTVGLSDIVVLGGHPRRARVERLVPRTAWTAAVAGGRARRRPGRFPGAWRPGWAGALRSARPPYRPVVRRAWLRQPAAASGVALRGQRPGRRAAAPLGRCEGVEPLHAGRPFPPLVRRDSSGREAWGGPGRQQASRALAGPFSFQIGGCTTDPEGVKGFCPTWGLAWPARPA
jgi:hypothetical protein